MHLQLSMHNKDTSLSVDLMCLRAICFLISNIHQMLGKKCLNYSKAKRPMAIRARKRQWNVIIVPIIITTVSSFICNAYHTCISQWLHVSVLHHQKHQQQRQHQHIHVDSFSVNVHRQNKSRHRLGKKEKRTKYPNGKSNKIEDIFIETNTIQHRSVYLQSYLLNNCSLCFLEKKKKEKTADNRYEMRKRDIIS